MYKNKGFTMKKLRIYLIENDIRQSDFAASLEVSRGHFNNVLNGNLRCSRELAHKISDLTNAEITYKEMLKFSDENRGRRDRRDEPQCEEIKNEVSKENT